MAPRRVQSSQIFDSQSSDGRQSHIPTVLYCTTNLPINPMLIHGGLGHVLHPLHILLLLPATNTLVALQLGELPVPHAVVVQVVVVHLSLSDGERVRGAGGQGGCQTSLGQFKFGENVVQLLWAIVCGFRALQIATQQYISNTLSTSIRPLTAMAVARRPVSECAEEAEAWPCCCFSRSSISVSNTVSMSRMRSTTGACSSLSGTPSKSRMCSRPAVTCDCNCSAPSVLSFTLLKVCSFLARSLCFWNGSLDCPPTKDASFLTSSSSTSTALTSTFNAANLFSLALLKLAIWSFKESLHIKNH